MQNNNKKIERNIQYRLILWSFYAVAVVMKNIFATKTWRLGFFQAPTGYIFEPITFIAQDVETETRGYASAKKMVFWGFLLNIIVALAAQLAIILPNASSELIQTSFEVVLGNVPRILIASLLAYLVGGTLNVKIMAKLKEKNNTSLFSRVIISTIFGQLADNLIFSLIAFYALMPLSTLLIMTLSMTLLETLYEIIFYPMTRFCIKKIKALEN